MCPLDAKTVEKFNFDRDVANHDATLMALGVTIWVGAEPTFTDRDAQTAEWLYQPLGGEKEQRAQALLDQLLAACPNGLALHTVGRQYPDEARPRWNLGLYYRRDGQPVWPRPEAESLKISTLAAWAEALLAEFGARGWLGDPVQSALAPQSQAQECRLLLRFNAEIPLPPADDPRLGRRLLQDGPIAAEGLRDDLAETGVYLFVLRWPSPQAGGAPQIELPLMPQVDAFLQVLACLARASAGLPGAVQPILTGYPPPADASVAWTTVTPDPAVIEVNAAPSPDAGDFLALNRTIHAAAQAEGLAAYRLYYNGTVADSGGAGQITLGGPTAETSPFLLEPRLLPRFVRYFNHHPALTYLFSHDYVGGGGQSVRADERGLDALDELQLALALLARGPEPTPEGLWHSLAPFLSDAVGNSHRAELNIEKLWNPFLGPRGKLGLVEFRALRMQHTPERATALACLLRAIAAMLSRQPFEPALKDWGRDLHDRFALPFYLEQDLAAIFADLELAGLGLGQAICQTLTKDEFRFLSRTALPGCEVELRRGLEFWPLLGDAASPEQGGSSRLVDASTARLELRLRPNAKGETDFHGWRGSISGMALPLRYEEDAQGPVRVCGLRYRAYVPAWGLHPSLGTQTPVSFTLHHAKQAQAYALAWHEWRPGGGGYPGLPQDLEAAAARRLQRLTVTELAAAESGILGVTNTPSGAPVCLDLRYLPAM